MKTSLKKSISGIDLFCGCGGMSKGFQNKGVRVLAAYDNWASAVSTYNRNFNHKAYISDIGAPSFIDEISIHNVDLIFGGPPCQDFSSAGPLQGASHRANLLLTFSKIVIVKSPKYFVLENVPRSRLSKQYAKSVELFKQAGYGLTEVVLDASYCGVPQSRKRLFLIGAKGAKNDFVLDRIKRNLSQKPLSMKEYFKDDIEIKHYFRVPTNYSRRGVFSVDEPCKTIRGVERPIPKGYPGHRDDSSKINGSIRCLTIEERARVQTFPKGYVFEGTKSVQNQLIGNAVPVKLAEFIAGSLLGYINEE